MRHYLDLVKISKKQHKKQDGMIRFCIVLSVFLVTVIFGMADMEMRSQYIQAVKTDGNWHAAFHVDKRDGALLGMRPEVEEIAAYGAVNYRLKDGYEIQGVETCICGLEEEFLSMFPDVSILEGNFPKDEEEAVLNVTAKRRLGLSVGDSIALRIPQGQTKKYRIVGITEDTALEAEHDAFGMFLNTEGFTALHTDETEAEQEMMYYVRFRSFCNIQRAIRDISAEFGLKEGQVRQNAKVLALLFQSRDTYMMQFYFVAAVLAALVVTAGVLMVAASMNSNVAKRTEFFGMMCCLGATKKQIRRFVRKEALGWCRVGIPAGLLFGTLVVWILCEMLRFLSPSLFEGLPGFGISPIGLTAGIVVGIVTVLLAAKSPAKRAASVSPLTAVTGNANTVYGVKKAANTRFLKIDMALGIHHAWGSRKNLFLVAGSFAFSIILFLAFSTAIDFMHHAINPLRLSAPDIYFYTEDTSNSIPCELAKELTGYQGVKRVFGRSLGEVKVQTQAKERELTLLSYDDQQFSWARDSLLEGDVKDAVEGQGLLLVYLEDSVLKENREVTLLLPDGARGVRVSGVLSNIPYDSDRQEMAVCSEKMFEDLTGERDYAVLDLQLLADAKDSDVEKIRERVGEACGGSIAFSDKRIGNREVKGASYSMAVFLYGFLAVIALIAFFNIINCIGMSVSARGREYGAMRAVGMGTDQLVRMVFGETVTYAVFGVIFGCGAGIPINRKLFSSLVTMRWGDAWELPGKELLVIVAVMCAAVCLAVIGPARQIKKSGNILKNFFQ